MNQDLDVTIGDIVGIVSVIVGDETSASANACFELTADLDGNGVIGVQVLCSWLAESLMSDVTSIATNG